MVFAYWGGASIWPDSSFSWNWTPKNTIIREKGNESKGLLPRVTSPPPTLPALHRVEEFVVVLGGTKLVEEEFGRLELVHAEKQLPQDPDFRKDVGLYQQFFTSSARAIHVDRRVHAFLRHAAIQVDLRVAGALEFLVDHVIHARAGVDERRRDDGERSAFFDVACRAEETLGPLQGIRVDATREHLAGGRDDRVVGAGEARDRIQ